MGRTTEVLTGKMLMLNEAQLAEVEQFVENLRRGGDSNTTPTSAAVSERAFSAVWNNPEDEIYDGL